MAGRGADLVARGLRAALRDLPEPGNYLRGCAQSLSALPRNVLLFTRTSPEQLAHAISLHYRYVLICALEGAGSVIVDEHLLRLEAGQAILVFPLQGHYYADLARDNPLWLFITFEYDRAQDLRRLSHNPVRLMPEDEEIMLQLLGDFTACRGDACAAGVCRIMGGLLERAAAPTGGGQGGAIPAGEVPAQAMRWINANIGEPFALKEVAAAVSLSESRLRTVFREKTGMSLGEYVRLARIQHACLLLIRGADNVGQTAEKCGFSSLYAFSRCFKQVTGLSPRDYLRRHEQQHRRT